VCSSDLPQQGYYFPIDAIDAKQVAGYRQQLENLLDSDSNLTLGYNKQLNHMHVVSRFANEIVRNKRILDIVEAIIGPDILVWGSTFFVKQPNTEGFVSWHQDLRYWGLEDSNALVSAWLALGPVNKANGCMRFIPASHRNGLVEHSDNFEEDNFLYRGQRAQVEINESSAVHVELEPGQISLHHGYLLHASAPNHSNQYRLGYTMNFIAPHNRQVIATTDYAMLVRGQDRYGYFEPVPAPQTDFSETALAWHNRVLKAHDEATFAGAASGANS
jgi:ectoine hydroxylase-related dioxygenase (phytanoyl-CoA dioxygenase family)